MNITNATASNTELPNNNSRIIDYDAILKSYGILKKDKYDYYYKIGNNPSNQGWMFHIPVWDIQFESLAEKLIPFLIKFEITFGIPIDNTIHGAIQGGSFGYKNLGKIITIIPTDENSLVILAKQLIELTEGYKGTPVPTDFHLGNIVYTRYGNYNCVFLQSDTLITDDKGRKIKDEESIPPKIYNWSPWPFGEIIEPALFNDKKILNNKYLIRKIIKPDIKGRVMAALYQKKFFNFKTCIIKEGIKGVAVDNVGRDITERIDWQLKLYENLNHLISIPKIIDNFEDENSKYIVFEFINGKSFGNYLADLYQGNSWYELGLNEKLSILNILIQIIENTKKIHQAGYVHRDLNVENIFIDNDFKVWLLDLELMYNVTQKVPYPPFERGTEGYISPEQILLFTPEPEQDIYSLGALLLISLLHISPEKYNTENTIKLKKQISFFNNCPSILNLISDCLNHEKTKRPGIDLIIETLTSYKKTIGNPSIILENNNLNRPELEKIITKAIYSLTCPSMLNSQGYWSSPISTNDNFVGNIRLDRTIYTGFRKGISGILFTIGEANMSIINTSNISEILSINYELISNIIQSEESLLETGFYKGSYGMGVALSSLMKSNQIPINQHNLNLLNICVKKIPESLNIAEGLSGYGIALLKCKDFLSENFIQERLQVCFQIISSKQLSDGSWHFITNDIKKYIETGFAYGVAGIIWFLLSYSDIYKNDQAQIVAIKGLNYLLKKIKKINNSFTWPLTIGIKGYHDFSNGGYLMLLPFIKAYKITQNIKYKQVVEKVLNAYPKQLVSNMFTLERGAAGIGEVYLEAWEAFGNDEWLKRAEWIAGSLINTSYNKDNYSYWLLNDPFHPHADLLTGNSGIIHFLLRMYRPDIIKSIY